jgi:hypothetical protein
LEKAGIMSASEQAVLNTQWNAAAEAIATEQARRAPHVLLSPRIFLDGDQWCALLGENLVEGVAGFGDTPEKACAEFDKAFRTQRCGRAV